MIGSFIFIWLTYFFLSKIYIKIDNSTLLVFFNPARP
jgi:hypothetical protein